MNSASRGIEIRIVQNPAAMKSPPHGAILRHQAVLLLPTIPQLWVAGGVLAGSCNKIYNHPEAFPLTNRTALQVSDLFDNLA